MHTVHRHHWVALPRVALLMGVALSHVCHFLATSSAAGCAATDDSPWERLRSAVLDPSMSAAAHSYVLGGESKNFVRDDESEHLHDTDIRVVGPSRGPRRALEWCFQPYKSTTAARGIAWSFAGAVDPECFWNRLWAALMFGAVVFQIYALMYASAFLNTGGSWPARLDVEMLIVDILYDTPTGVALVPPVAAGLTGSVSVFPVGRRVRLVQVHHRHHLQAVSRVHGCGQQDHGPEVHPPKVLAVVVGAHRRNLGAAHRHDRPGVWPRRLHLPHPQTASGHVRWLPRPMLAALCAGRVTMCGCHSMPVPAVTFLLPSASGNSTSLSGGVSSPGGS